MSFAGTLSSILQVSRDRDASRAPQDEHIERAVQRPCSVTIAPDWHDRCPIAQKRAGGGAPLRSRRKPLHLEEGTRLEPPFSMMLDPVEACLAQLLDTG